MTITFKIPATSANLGLGFDSMGIAVQKYLTITAETADDWHVDFLDKELEVLPTDANNLVFRAAEHVANEYDKVMPKLSITMASQIPLTHGLGSSSSAIVAGIELANHFLELSMSEEDKIFHATALEGHPDNVGPCITGGAFAGYYSIADGLYYEQFNLDGVGLIVSIPDYEISTEQARLALPKDYSSHQAIAQNAMNNVMIMKALKQDYKAMGALMMKDHLHEPYRQSLIKEFDDIKDVTLDQGAYATVISGAGPTVLTLAPEDKMEKILEELSIRIPECVHESIGIHYN
ncbi:homoserine kinase [Aerococcaceae bacterium DSM 111022]|nr:homoserine kinase [Aerococcaceae bacterium DSM 111022]MBG9988336.1 homoserine kinase [Aerococcaceae bacterium DSM 111176]